MKIRILRRSIHHDAIHAVKGDVIEVPEDLAKAWIHAGYAEAAGESSKPKKRTPAQ